MDAYERGKIIDALKSDSYPSNHYIIREGEQGDKFYIVEQGQCVATKTLMKGQAPQNVKDYFTGDYFGELAILKDMPRAANIITKGEVKCVSLDRDTFKRLLGPLESILKRNAEAYSKYVENS